MAGPGIDEDILVWKLAEEGSDIRFDFAPECLAPSCQVSPWSW